MAGIVDKTGDDRTIGSNDRSRNYGDVISSGGIQRLAGDELACDRETAVERREIEIILVRAAGVVAVGRYSRDNAGVGIDAEAGGQRRRVGQRVVGGGSREVAGEVEREALTL